MAALSIAARRPEAIKASRAPSDALKVTVALASQTKVSCVLMVASPTADSIVATKDSLPATACSIMSI